MRKRSACVLAVLLFASCAPLQRRDGPTVTEMVRKPLPPEEAEVLLEDAANEWFYGPGLGNTAVKTATALSFPPYALYLLGSAALTVAGYEPVGLYDVLPESQREDVLGVYEAVTSVPGKVTSSVAGQEFQPRHISVEEYLRDEQN